jgi:PPP family 3-phenylpropionic acid transporter
MSALYLFYFALVGLWSPFLPAYLTFIGLTPSEVGILLGISPLVAVVAPPLWGQRVDRSGKPEQTTMIIGLGMVLAFAPLLWLRGFWPLFATLGTYACFATTVPPILDSITLGLANPRWSYARIRMSGSLGFVLASAIFGAFATSIDATVIELGLAANACFLATSLAMGSFRSKRDEPRARDRLAGASLLRDPGLVVFLAICCLHWIACAPFNGMFSIYLQSLGFEPFVIGLSAAVSVASEMFGILLHPRVAARLSVRQILLVCFLGSALRWVAIAVTASRPVMVALQVGHSVTFGLFYVTAVEFVHARVNAGLRTTGQTVFLAVTFGLGGLVGYSGGGVAYDAIGGSSLFLVAAGLDVCATLATLRFLASPSVARP